MPAPTDHPEAPATATDPTASRRSPLGRAAVAVALLLVVGLWGYVVYLAVGPGRQDPPDRLDDPTFARAAEERCQQALDVVAALPAANTSTSPAERAEVLDRATDAFEAMVEDLGRMVPDGEDGVIVERWLADWDVYLGDRREHADILRTGEDRQFQVSARNKEHITKYLDGFAADNSMPACGSPLDV